MNSEIPLSKKEQKEPAASVPETLGTATDPSKNPIRSLGQFENDFFGGFVTQAGIMNSAGNKFWASRSVNFPEFLVFAGSPLPCRILLWQHPRFLSAIDWPDAAHTRQERAT
jgi:hypothetical protein